MEKKKLIDFTIKELVEATREKSAYPGGGAVTSMIGNLGINLILMMTKKDYKDEKLNKKGKKLEKKFLEYSKELEDLMQEDIDNANILLDAYKNKNMDNIDLLIQNANKAPIRTSEIMIIILQDCDFLLENGGISTLSDGEIGLRLIKETIYSSFVNVIMNEKHLSKNQDYKKTDYKSIIEYCDKLYKNNMEIIRKREKKWEQ